MLNKCALRHFENLIRKLSAAGKNLYRVLISSSNKSAPGYFLFYLWYLCFVLSLYTSQVLLSNGIHWVNYINQYIKTMQNIYISCINALVCSHWARKNFFINYSGILQFRSVLSPSQVTEWKHSEAPRAERFLQTCKQNLGRINQRFLTLRNWWGTDEELCNWSDLLAVAG